MNVQDTSIPEVKLIIPKVFSDDRGYFFESFRKEWFEENIQSTCSFVQENESMSSRGVLRGLHFQLPPFAQAKLVRVVKGKVLDVAVDIRKGSETFGKHVAVVLSAENKRQLFIPKGFAHGFLTLEDDTIFSYKVDNVYAPEYDRSLLWEDPQVGIDWGMDIKEIILSDKDKRAPSLGELQEVFEVSDESIGDRSKRPVRL